MFVPTIGIPVWVALVIALIAIGVVIYFFSRERRTSDITENKSWHHTPVALFGVVGLIVVALLLITNSFARHAARDNALEEFEKQWNVTVLDINGLFPIEEDQSVPVIVESGGRLYDALITTRGGQYDLKYVNYPYDIYPYPIPYGAGVVMEDQQLGTDGYPGAPDAESYGTQEAPTTKPDSEESSNSSEPGRGQASSME